MYSTSEHVIWIMKFIAKYMQKLTVRTCVHMQAYANVHVHVHVRTCTTSYDLQSPTYM